nr:myosin-4-like [Quercus suber]
MGFKRQPQTSLLDLLEGQPRRDEQGKSQSKLPPSPSKFQSTQTRSFSAQSKLPPLLPQSSLPPRLELADPKRKKDPKGKGPMVVERTRSSPKEAEARRPLKQQKTGYQSQDREVADQFEAQAWLPAPMLHREPLMDDASLRNFRGGEGAYTADALKRSLLLPADMAQLEGLKRQEVILSMKRYLGMAVQAIYRLEEEASKQSRALEQERDGRLDASRVLSKTNGDLKKAREALKEATKARDSAATGLRLAEAVTVRGVAEHARDEALRAKAEAESAWAKAESSKEQAKEEAFAEGVAKTEAAFKAQVPEVCRRYYSQTWEETLNQAGVEASSDLRRAEKVYYPPAIREATSATSEANTVPEAANKGQVGAAGGPTSIDRPVEGAEHQRVPGEGKLAVQAIYRLEEEASKQSRALEQERDGRLDASRVLSKTNGDLKKAREALKEATKARDSAATGLRLAEAVTVRGVAEHARDEALRAKAEAESAWAKAESSQEQAKEEAFAEGVAKTEAAFKAQVPEVCRRYYSQTWEETLNQAGVEASSDLRRAEKVYYPPAIREATSATSEANTVPEAANKGQVGAAGGPTSIDRPVEGAEHQRVPGEGKLVIWKRLLLALNSLLLTFWFYLLRETFPELPVQPRR